MSTIAVQGFQSNSARGLYKLPPRPIRPGRLRAIARRSMKSGDVLTVQTPDKSYCVRHDGDIHVESREDKRPLTLEGSLRVEAMGKNPRRLVGAVGRGLNLEERKPRGRIAASTVKRFIGKLARSPQSFAGSYVHAQLDAWGARAVLPHLTPRLMPEATDYVDYAARYLNRALRGGARDRSSHVFSGFGVKPWAGDDHASVSVNGWPVRGRIPLDAAAMLVDNREVELLADWRKADFIARVTRNLEQGGIMLSTRVGSLRSLDWADGTTSVITPSQGATHLHDIERRINMFIEPWEECGSETFRMILRAARIMGNDVVPGRKPASTNYALWKLHFDPLDPSSWTTDLRGVVTDAVHRDGGLRFFRRDRWMRIGAGIVAGLRYGEEEPPPDAPWGVIADGRDEQEAYEMMVRAEGRLEQHVRVISTAEGDNAAMPRPVSADHLLHHPTAEQVAELARSLGMRSLSIHDTDALRHAVREALVEMGMPDWLAQPTFMVAPTTSIDDDDGE